MRRLHGTIFNDMSERQQNAYDAIAPFYREYSGGRAAYLAAVDNFIVENAPAGAASVLDVGAGDGVRGMALAKRLKADRIVLCEPSAEMAQRCRGLGLEVWQVAAEDMPENAAGFDVILCLWNVLGHVDGTAARIRALQRIARLLTDRGVVFFDVNNRHNASAYGWIRVLGRAIVDSLRPDEHRGDASFEWHIGEVTIPAMGHLFTPGEVERIVTASGLRVRRTAAVDYVSGKLSQCAFRGQLLYMAGKPT